jgi:tetratricopeptide (TPR) repeat protein
MNLTEKEIAQLEAYQMGLLSESEQQQIKLRLDSDTDFEMEANSYLALFATLETVGDKNTKTFLKDIDKTMPPLKNNTENPLNTEGGGIGGIKLFLVALAIALAAIAVWYFALRKPEIEKPKLSPLIAMYFAPYPALGITRGVGDENIKKEALTTYAVNDFKHAIPLLEKAFAVEKDSILLFYKGIAHIGVGEFAQSIALLEPMQSSETLPFESVTWYLALAYLESNQKEKALVLLQKCADTEGEYREKAIALRAEIK